jgi:hypothetical protein
MATTPPVSPDIIEPQSPPESPPSDPMESPVPAEPTVNPDGGDYDAPGQTPDEVPPSQNAGPLDK